MKYYAEQSISFSSVLICGMCRVGKTLIGSVISAAANVEYTEEPWAVTNIAKIAGEKYLDKEFAKEMLAAAVKNLFDETYIMRNVNFRPMDLSYIGKKKTQEEINYRLNQTRSYRDCQSVAKRKIFAINLSEVLSELDFVYHSLPRCKVIYMIRHAQSVVNEVVEKGWFSNDWIIELDKSQLLRNYGKYYLPFFIEGGDEEYFLSLNEYERGFYYYNSLIKRTFQSSRTIFSKNCLIVRYEDFISNPISQYKIIKNFLKLEDGAYTRERLSEIHRNLEKPEMKMEVDVNLIQQTNVYLNKFGYEEINDYRKRS